MLVIFLAFFLICPVIIVFSFGFFGILYEGLAIKAPRPSTIRHLIHLIKFLFDGKLSALPPVLLFLNFLSFSCTFPASKHPLRMTTQGMYDYKPFLLEVEGHWVRDPEAG